MHRSTESSATEVSRRCRLASLGRHLQRSVLATCLPHELLQELVPSAGTGKGAALDAACRAASSAEAGADRLDAALNQLHRRAIDELAHEWDYPSLSARWLAAAGSADMPGIYWALLTHPLADRRLRHLAFGDVELLRTVREPEAPVAHVLERRSVAPRRLGSLELLAPGPRHRAGRAVNAVPADETAPVVCRPLGFIRSGFAQPVGTPIQTASAPEEPATLDLLPAYAAGLRDLEGFQYLILLTHFHLCTQERLEVTPFLDDRSHGVFATRAPARPNRLGLSIVQLLRIEGNTLHLQGNDMVDGTPVLDIKPYVPRFDVRGTDRIGWFAKRLDALPDRRADDRMS